MRAVGEETLEPGLGLRHRVGARDACGIEALRARLLDQRRLDRGRIGQKSRLA
jgi:hypothetical protein